MPETATQDSRSPGHATLPVERPEGLVVEDQWLEKYLPRVRAHIPFGTNVIDDRLPAIGLKKNDEHERVVCAIRNTHRSNLKQMFCALSPPRMESLVGEYDAELLDQGGLVRNALTRSIFAMKGTWLGKAFQPLGMSEGVGYNLFRTHGTVVRRLPMDTTITKSILDDRYSLQISYDAKSQGLVRGLVGEIRQVTTNVLFGIGVFGPSPGIRKTWGRKIPFLLIGPNRRYQRISVGEANTEKTLPR